MIETKAEVSKNLEIPLTLIVVCTTNRTPLVLAVSFPLRGRVRDFHPLETCAARPTRQGGGIVNATPAALL